MRWYLILSLLLAWVLAGCSNPDRNKIVGVWVAETADKLSDRITGDGSEDEVFEPKLEVQFQWSGKLKTVTRMGTINREKNGTWELTHVEANQLTLSCTLGDPKMGSQTTELKIKILDENTIRMTPPNMAGLSTKMKFKKK